MDVAAAARLRVTFHLPVSEKAERREGRGGVLLLRSAVPP